MPEWTAFIPFTLIQGAKLFAHLHKPEQASGIGYLFLNPFFDEKKRVQRFQARLARELCSRGASVIRFDYYGTGDSSGESFEATIPDLFDSIRCAEEFALEAGFPRKLVICGIRMGATLAVRHFRKHERILHRILIQPVVSGADFLREQRARRAIFWRMNGMKGESPIVHHEGRPFEDFQGNLVSAEFTRLMAGLHLADGDAGEGTSILAVSGSLPPWLEKDASAFLQMHGPDFWAHPEEFEMDTLVADILGIHRELENQCA